MKTKIFKVLSVLILSFILFSFSSIFSQTISIGNISRTEYCSGNSMLIPFSVNNIFDEFEIKVQLSSASGSFSGVANYIYDKSFSSNTVSGTLTAPIPSSVATGYSYRIRLVCKIKSLIIFSPMNTSPLVIGRQTSSSKPTPAFSIPSSICSGTQYSLPISSTNGVSGTWSPSFNNTVTTNTTTTYTFTPALSCFNNVNKTITVNANVTPTFNAVEAVCSGSTINALPTQSTNNITGTWSPALNNTQTTTYTFTPTSGLCALTNTMTVVVTPRTTPTFNELSPKCAGSTISNLPQTSLNGIVGTWSPSINNQQTTTYTFTPNSNMCSFGVTATQIVNPVLSPLFSQIAPICSGQSFSLPTTSENGISGSWSPALNNTSTTTYTFTPSAGICANSIEMTVVVNPIITPVFEQVSSICEGSSFELSEISENGVGGTWSPALNNSATTTYTFTPNLNLCANTNQMTVVVNPIVTPLFSELSPICTGEFANELPQTSLNGIVGTWSPSINNQQTTTYTFTPNADFCSNATNAILIVNPRIISDTTVESCMSYTWPVNGQTYTTSGIYTYVSGCTESSLNLTIKQPSVLASPSIINGTTVGLCLGGITNPIFSILPLENATSYEWTVPAGATIVSGQGTNTVTLNITGDFTIGSLSVKAANVCTTSVSRTITIRGVLASPGTISGTITGICQAGNSSPSYLAAAVAGATGYTWTSPAGTSITSGQGTTSISLNIGNSFVTGNLIVTADNACGSSVPKTLAINSVTLMPGVITGTSVGLGTNGITTATYTTTNVVGASDYLWTIPAGTEIVSGQGTNSITLNFTSAFTSGSLSVEARNACGSSAKRMLTLLSVPLTPGTITGITSGLCSQGTSTATYSIAAVNGALYYMWTAPAGATIISGQGTTSVTISFSSSFTSGSLSVCACNTCGSSTVKTLALNSVPLTPGTVTGTTNNLCTSGVSNPTYSIAAVAGATSYTWTAPTGMTITSGQGTASIAMSVSDLFNSGALTLVANNACGSSLVKSVTLSTTPLTPASITGSAAPCGTTTYTCATVAQAVSYTWTVPAGLTIVSGQGTNTITVDVTSSTVSGSITVKASNNCKTGAAKSMVVTSCTAKSMLTTTDEVDTENNVSQIEAVVYPNPTNGEVNIEFSNELENNVKVELYDMIGNKVSRVEMPAGSTVANLTLEGMTSGMYLIQVVDSNNDILYKAKVSKQ